MLSVLLASLQQVECVPVFGSRNKRNVNTVLILIFFFLVLFFQHLRDISHNDSNMILFIKGELLSLSFKFCNFYFLHLKGETYI